MLQPRVQHFLDAAQFSAPQIAHVVEALVNAGAEARNMNPLKMVFKTIGTPIARYNCSYVIFSSARRLSGYNQYYSSLHKQPLGNQAF
jgi:hypothetical protein